MKLAKLIYITRHGNRGPLIQLKNSPWGQKELGTLTDKGRKKLYNKGNEFASQKQDFFKGLRWPEDVFMISSNMQRTMDSGYCLIKAFQNIPQDNATFQDKIKYLNSFGFMEGSIINDLIFKGYDAGYLPGLVPYYKKLIRTQKLKGAHEKELHGCKDACMAAHNLNLDAMSYMEIFNMVDHLICVQSNDMEFICKEDYKIVKELASMHYFLLYDLMYIEDNVKRFTNHFFYKALIKNLSEGSKKLYFYSSHDANILSALLGMGFTLKEVPPFCSNVVISLYDNSHAQYVDVQYQGKSIYPKLIPLNLFETILKQNSFENDDAYFKEGLIDNIKKLYAKSKLSII